MSITRCLWLFVCAQLLAGYATAMAADTKTGLWEKLAVGSYVVLLHHADAPHSTQRQLIRPPLHCRDNNTLSEKGRSDVRWLKEQLQRNGVSIGRVLTSHDCRCVQTAGIAFGVAEPWSIADEAIDEEKPANTARSEALREAISRWTSKENLAIVSHQSTFQQAINVYPEENQLLVIQPLGDGGFRLLGRLDVAQPGQ